MRRSSFPVVALIALGCRSEAPSTTPARASAKAEPAAAEGAGAEPAPSAEPPPVEGDTKRVVLPRDQAETFFKMRGGKEKLKESFAPSAAEIDELEAGLGAMLKEKVKTPGVGLGPLWERAPSYMRQYIGFVDASGKRWIWANFFCDNPGPPGSDVWRSKIVTVDDGGDCFFNFEYSPESGTYRKLSINGDG